MTNLTRSNFQAHPFHLVSPSPWPLFTSVSLLTLTTTGVPFNTLVTSRAICWKTLILIIVLGLSAGNLLSLNFSGIFRDYTLEFLFCAAYVFMFTLLCLSVNISADSYGKDTNNYVSSSTKDETNNNVNHRNTSMLSH